MLAALEGVKTHLQDPSDRETLERTTAPLRSCAQRLRDLTVTPLTFALFGGVGSGKSTFLNSVLGHQLAPTSGGGASCTQVPTAFNYGRQFSVEVEYMTPAEWESYLAETGEMICRMRQPAEEDQTELKEEVKARVNGIKAVIEATGWTLKRIAGTLTLECAVGLVSDGEIQTRLRRTSDRQSVTASTKTCFEDAFALNATRSRVFVSESKK
jgi:hypothetical protein